MNKRQARLIENLLVAQAMVMDLPNRKFVPRLSEFANYDMMEHGPNHCGSAACFGGWVALHPYFQKQGVKPNKDDGAPRSRKYEFSMSVSEELFGDGYMFASASYYEYGLTEKQEVLQRIERQLARVLVGEYR